MGRAMTIRELETREAIKSSRVGKKMPTAIYIHKSCAVEPLIPKLLDQLINEAGCLVIDSGNNWLANEDNWDVAKVASDGSSVSFLTYPGFTEIRNPILSRSVCVNFDKGTVKVTDYGSRRNPPILHRKEQMMEASQLLYATFAEQTAEDEALGLLGRPGIGTLNGWVRAQQEVRDA